MINTLFWRFKVAFQVLMGKVELTSKKNTKKNRPKVAFDFDQPFVVTKEISEFLSSLSIEFCFSEFGEQRVNAGGANFQNTNRLEPSLSTLRRYFPNAKYTVYSDIDLDIDGVELKKVTSPIPDKNHPRYLYRTADYFKFKSLLDSDADFKCVIDSDMFVVSEEIYRLVYLTKIFGFCAPFNIRNLLKKDMEISLDTIPISDCTKGYGHSYNQSPMTLWKNNNAGRAFFEKCCELMIKEPSRASRVMWNAAKETGTSPYLLPAEFCVCKDQEGIDDEVILHVGHPSVAKFYNIKTKR